MSKIRSNLFIVLIVLLFNFLTIETSQLFLSTLIIPEIIIKFSRWILVFTFLIYSILKKNLTTWIFFSMIFGIVVGVEFSSIAVELRILSKIFLKLIKTIIAPILFSTLVVGIAKHTEFKKLGKIGFKSLLYFEVVTTLALIIGLVVINLTKAGEGINLKNLPQEDLPIAESQTWQDIILHIFPENFIKSIYEGQVLQIVVFSLLFGIALAMLPKHHKKPMIKFCDSLAETMFKFTSIIMYFAPFGIGGAMAYTVGHMGIEILIHLFQLLLSLYFALFIFIILVLLPIMLYFKIPIYSFIKAISKPVSIAFATTSSESALPLLMKNMEKFGVPQRIVSFVIPMGYSFNLDGTTLYLSLASIFVAQAAGVPLSIQQQILIGLTLMLTSKGVAGVPRASLIILIGVCATFNIPIWPIAAILGIDELMDMARTSVNVIGNALASCVIAKSEKEFELEKALNFKDENLG
jgi:proton glutamate symport protein